MPEIALCRNCTACADFTDAELQLLQDARMWKLRQRNVDDLFADRLAYTAAVLADVPSWWVMVAERKTNEAAAKMWREYIRSTKKLSEPE
jgi:hypothetical protein